MKRKKILVCFIICSLFIISIPVKADTLWNRGASLIITSPNGGEILQMGSDVTVSWTLDNFDSWSNEHEAIQLHVFDGTGQKFIGNICVSCSSGKTGGSFVWKVGNVGGSDDQTGWTYQIPAGRYKIRAAVVSNISLSDYPLDFSDAAFDIVNGQNNPFLSVSPALVNLKAIPAFKINVAGAALNSHIYLFDESSDGTMMLGNYRIGSTDSSDKFSISLSQFFVDNNKEGEHMVWVKVAGVESNKVPIFAYSNPNLVCQDASLRDGDLIRETGSVDVYIIKYVGQKKFKRLILSPSVFNSYRHLRWENIRNVNSCVFNSFATSNLVRSANDLKVYELNPSGDIGEKRWVSNAEIFSFLGLDWDSVYQINQVDRDSYTIGQDLK